MILSSTYTWRKQSRARSSCDGSIAGLTSGSGAPVITIVGKTWDLHVDEVLRVGRDLLAPVRPDPDALAEARRHGELHATYKPDDNARDRAVVLARQKSAPANHAAEAVVLYDLERPGAYELESPAAEEVAVR